MGYRHVEWNDEWITENYLRYPSYKEMAKAYNEKFGTDIKPVGLKGHARNKLGIEKPRETHRHYTKEQIEFLKENYPKYGCGKTLEMFNKRFNETRTWSSMKNFGTCYGIHVDEKVAIENKLKPVRAKGSKRAERNVGEVREENGRIVIKMPSGKWEQIGRGIWELNGREIPKGYSVIHLDGNVNNYNIDNLLAVPQKYVGLLQKYGMRSDSAEVTKTGVMWCKLYDALGLKKGDLKE